MTSPLRTSRAGALALLALLACGTDPASEEREEPAGLGEDDPSAARDAAKSDDSPGRPSDAGRLDGDGAKPGSRDAGSRDGASVDSAPPSKSDGGASRDGSLEARPADAAAPTSGDAAAANDSPAACPAMKLSPGNRDGKVAVGGHDRSYLLYVPKGYTGNEPIPLIFDFHGYGQSVTSQKNASGFATLADQHGFAVVYPAGVGGSWHVNGCCGQAAQEKIDEVAVVRAQLEHIEAQLCVDKKRVYASGISQGGGMAHHVGCLAADVFAAVAPVSSDLRTEPCMPSRPISELSFRGMADTLSAYEGGPVGPTGMQYQSIGAKPTLERWKSINMCSGSPEKTHELCETYKQCAAGVEVTLCTLPRGGHGLYSNPERFNLAEFAWSMFERQRLP